jgi:hypothetical protein
MWQHVVNRRLMASRARILDLPHFVETCLQRPLGDDARDRDHQAAFMHDGTCPEVPGRPFGDKAAATLAREVWRGSASAAYLGSRRGCAVIAQGRRWSLEQAPHPFSPVTKEKKASLRRFQPHGVLISDGQDRANGAASTRPFSSRNNLCMSWLHPGAQIVQAEAEHMLAHSAELDWDLVQRALVARRPPSRPRR